MVPSVIDLTVLKVLHGSEWSLFVFSFSLLNIETTTGLYKSWKYSRTLLFLREFLA